VPGALTYEVKPGMTKDEVHAILGKPNWRQSGRDGEELWGYYIKEFGCSAWLNPILIQLEISVSWR
jgi:outer membrane protein assembly factor BamE (lipoprotein component of BamABCDE complex)